MSSKGARLTGHLRADLLLIYLIAVANVGTRSLIAYRSPRGTSGELGWVFTAVDIVLIACAVHITGRLSSDLWLIYFFLVVTETLSVSVKAEIALDIIVALGYTAAVWPVADRMTFATRLFFLFLTGAIARRLHSNAETRGAQVSRLREELKVEQEKSRLAREIHDGVGREIVNAILGLEVAARLAELPPRPPSPERGTSESGRVAGVPSEPLPSGTGGEERAGVRSEPAAVSQLIRENIGLLRSAMESTRQLIFETRPWTLDESASRLGERIAEYARRFADRTGMTVDVYCDAAIDDVPESTAFAILRVMQESLNNAAKHAGAKSITIRAACVGHEMRLTVIDDGVGFDASAVDGDGIGLKSMSERANALRGRLDIDSAPGRGSTIVLTVPLQ